MNTKLNNIEWINSKRPWSRRTRVQCHEVTFVVFSVWHVSAFKQLHVSNHVGFNVHKSQQKMEQTWTCCWQLLIHMCVFLSQYLVRAAPASPSGAPSWTPAAARSQSRPRRRNLWTRSPAGTPPGLPWTASSGALWTPHTHTHMNQRGGASQSRTPAGSCCAEAYSCAVWGWCMTWRAALFHPPRCRCPRSWGWGWRESGHK